VLPESKISQTARLVILFLALGMYSLLNVQTGQADGGGWPTATPTFIIYPTVTPIPTTSPYPYPKAVPLQIQSALPSPTFFLPTPVPESGSRKSYLICWPFALVFLLVVIIGGTVIIRRYRT